MTLMVEAMQEEVQVKRRTGFDENGEPEFAAAVPVFCKWTEQVQTITGRTGDQIVSMSQVWLRPDADVNIGDVLVRGGVEYDVHMVTTKTDIGSSPAYLKVFV